MARFRLDFPSRHIERLAAEFPDSEASEAGRLARFRGMRVLGRRELLALARWKTPRSRPRVASNPEGFVRAVTRTALTTPDERLRIEVLTLLSGVDWPTASVVLHFCHRDPYPVLDVRALWSLGVEKPSRYDFRFWWDYTRACRRIASAAACSMRTLDRALWQHAKRTAGGDGSRAGSDQKPDAR